MKNRIEFKQEKKKAAICFGWYQSNSWHTHTYTYKHSAMKKLDCEHKNEWIVFKFLLRIANGFELFGKKNYWYEPLLCSQAYLWSVGKIRAIKFDDIRAFWTVSNQPIP